MKRKSVLAFLLAFVLILTAMPITGSAADAGTYSLGDLLSDEHALTYTLDVDETNSKPGNLAGPTDSSHWLGNTGDAMEMRIMAEGKIAINTADEDGNRFFMDMDTTGSKLYVANGGSDISSSTVLTGQWVTLLVVNNGPGYDVYYKFDTDEGMTLLFSSTSSKERTDTNIWFSTQPDEYYIDYVKKYEKCDNLTNLLGDDYAVTYTYDADATTMNSGNPGAAPNSWLGSTGDAMEIRIKAVKDLTIYSNNSEGKRFGLSVKTTETSLEASPKASSSTILTGQWVTILAVNNGSGFDVYYKFDNDEFKTLLFKTTSTTNNRADGNIWIFHSNGEYYVDYAKKYAKVNDLATLFGDDYAVTYTWDYADKTTAKTKVTAPDFKGDETGKPYLGATGDALEMRIKVDSNVTIDATDNDEHRLNLTINGTSTSLYTFDNGGYTTASSTTVLTGQWVTLLVINNGPGYDVYYKFDGDTNYTGPVFETTSARTEAYAARSSIWFNGSNFYVDYVKKYGPAAGSDGLVVAVDEGSAINSLRAIVSGKSGSLIFAGYDANECLVEVTECPVDGTTAVDEETLNTATLDADVETVKVFFWNSLTGMVPVTTVVRSVSL